MAWTARLTLMNQTRQHALPVEKEYGRHVRGMIIDAIVSPENLPDDLTGYFSEKELASFWWLQVRIANDAIDIENIREWLLPSHVSLSEGRIQYSFANGAPQVGDTMLAETSGVTGDVVEIVANVEDDALRYTGNPDDFEDTEIIRQQDKPGNNARIQYKLKDKQNNDWFRLNNLQTVDGDPFPVGSVFEGGKNAGIGTSEELAKINFGRVRLDNVAGGELVYNESVTFTPSGVSAIITAGGFKPLARVKRIFPLNHSNTDPDTRNDLLTKGWSQINYTQLRNMIRRHPDETTPSKDADVMDAETLEDDAPSAGGGKKKNK